MSQKRKLWTHDGVLSVEEKEKSVTRSTGYNIDIFTTKTAALQYQCGICSLICNNPVELSCDDDDICNNFGSENDDNSHDILYCESCLSLYLSLNNNKCPINASHLNIKYNITKNIRKQINNLSVYCYNNTNMNNNNNNNSNEGNDNIGCIWNDKLFKLSAHLKLCKYNKIFCNICNKMCIENNINQHDKTNAIKHISFLHEILTKNTSKNNIPNKIKEKINNLQSDKVKLNEDIKALKRQFVEYKISMAIETTKKDLKHSTKYKLLHETMEKHSKSIDILTKKYQELSLKYETQNKLIKNLKIKNDKLQNEIYDKSPLITSKSVGLTKVNENDTENDENDNDDDEKDKCDDEEEDDVVGSLPNMKNDEFVQMPSMPPPPMPTPLKVTKSMKYFHPKDIEKYHPQNIKYEMYHPKKSKQVRVSKTTGNGTKLYHRYPCCGSAKKASLYLVKADDGKQQKEELYIVNNGKLPKNWHNAMHIGCKKNKKQNQQNTSFYPCCNGDVKSVGCKKRYKCCKQDAGKSSGCKIGWGC